MKRVVFQNDFVQVEADEDLRVVFATRSATAYASLDALRASNEERALALERFRGQGYALLVDNRKGPMRNDAAFEAEAVRARTVMLAMFQPVVIVVKTAVGALQVRRIGKATAAETNGAPTVFEDDFDGALKYLRETAGR